ncbi:hypothetical protein RB195_024477 [Necator americanus]|uniref:Endonuclease/exonuclease/phosphatase domain-containing protein n=1 Tax=Necator americanus TaxID=51031 RepID=A0ABR1ENG3_NECAM
MRTLKLQLDYVLTRNIPQSDIRKSRAVWDVAFDSDHRPVLLSFKIRFHKRNLGVPLQPKIDMAGLKDDECRRKFRQRVSIHVVVRTRKKLSDADSFTECIQDAAKETLPVLLPRKKFAFASAETKSTYNSVYVARSAGDFNQEKRLRRKLRRQLQQDRDRLWALAICDGRRLLFAMDLRRQDPRTILCVSSYDSTRKSVLEGSCVVNCNKTAVTSGRQEQWSLRRRGRTGTRGKPMLYQNSIATK